MKDTSYCRELLDQKEPYTIDLPDGHQITGTLRGQVSPDIPLCLLTHGNLGYGNGLLQLGQAL